MYYGVCIYVDEKGTMCFAGVSIGNWGTVSVWVYDSDEFLEFYIDKPQTPL